MILNDISLEEIFQKFNIAWKVSKYGVISGPYFPPFGLNTERYEKTLEEVTKRGHSPRLFAKVSKKLKIEKSK